MVTLQSNQFWLTKLLNNINMKRILALVTVVAITACAFIGLSFQGNAGMQVKNGLKLYELTGSPDYPDAELSLSSPAGGSVIPVGTDSFKFEVKNYKLGMQTPDADQKMCANSAKGQHIHFIMDDAPYIASYSPTVGADIKPGHHVLLAFLSRSYHESLKHKKSFILKEFNAGADAKSDFDAKAPHVFLSRPKGEYIGEKETGKVMLDFYLVNCDLSATGYKVKATVNGTEFILTKWAPYLIEGLPLGKSTVKLELLDKNNALVKSPFNGKEREFTLKMEPGK
jgi:hypothetical protein